jgi:hypothetical protein
MLLQLLQAEENYAKVINAFTDDNFEITLKINDDKIYKDNLIQGMTNPLGSTDIVNNYIMFAYNIPELNGIVDKKV